MAKKPEPDRLFPQPSIIAGIARLFDFGGNYDTSNSSATERQADDRTLAEDWSSVGDFLREAADCDDDRDDSEKAA